MTHARKSENVKKKCNRLLPAILITAITLTFGLTEKELWAGGNHHKPIVENLEVAEIYFELNNTDGDLGIHGKIDGGPWEKIWIKDSNHRPIMKVTAKGRLRKQAVTELFFESAEPTFDELAPQDFFNRFPEGTYRIYGLPQEGKLLVGQSEIRHVMPAPPDGITVSGTPLVLADIDCEMEAPLVGRETNGDVIISWAPVVDSHPDLGEEGDIEVARYQLVVEMDVDLNGDEFESVYSVDLPPDVTSMTVPAAFINLGLDEDGEGEYKFEILVKEDEGGNQTATESCFAIGEIGQNEDK
jgi:hypothetical protein